jgi:hypothetical protein
MTSFEKYKLTVKSLYAARTSAGGTLTPHQEMDWAARLSELWTDMSSEERREVDTLVEAREKK